MREDDRRCRRSDYPSSRNRDSEDELKKQKMLSVETKPANDYRETIFSFKKFSLFKEEKIFPGCFSETYAEQRLWSIWQECLIWGWIVSDWPAAAQQNKDNICFTMSQCCWWAPHKSGQWRVLCLFWDSRKRERDSSLTPYCRRFAPPAWANPTPLLAQAPMRRARPHGWSGASFLSLSVLSVASHFHPAVAWSVLCSAEQLLHQSEWRKWTLKESVQTSSGIIL